MTKRKAHLDAFAVVTIVFCCFLWGLNQVAAKAAMPEIPALWQAAACSSAARSLVWLWAASRGEIVSSMPTAPCPAGCSPACSSPRSSSASSSACSSTTALRMVVWIYIAPFVVALGMPLISRSAAEPDAVGRARAGVRRVAWAFAEGFSSVHVGASQWIGDALGMAAGATAGRDHALVRATKLGHELAEKTLLYQLAVSALMLAIRTLSQ